MLQIRDPITMPLDDIDLDVLDNTTRLATGEVVCDLIPPPVRIPKELEDDEEGGLKVSCAAWYQPL